MEIEMLDREYLDEFLEHLADRYTAAEIVDLLEDAGILNVWTIIASLEEEIIKGKDILS